jgi:hypothetical protein
MLLWVFLLATRKTFLVNHAHGIASMGLFVVPTIPFRLLCGFLILLHARGELLWLGVTNRRMGLRSSSPRRLAGEMRRDMWSVIGIGFTAPGSFSACGPWAFGIGRSPWQNGYAERLIGSIRRDCLAHLVVFGASRIFAISCARIKDSSGPMQGRADPARRPASGRIVVAPVLGGLHHQ